MAEFGYNPAPKPKFKRRKPTQGQHTAITVKVDKEVYRRSSEAGYTKCERCGCSVPRYRFERAHMINASQYGTGRSPWNIVVLCGPKTATGTCHNWVDETADGRAWKVDKQAELYIYYTVGDGKQFWK
ncbi:hypothetical protein HW560_15600 [Paenibacillus sp. E222]|uniref:hypothetical protein n=1 Tax=Paenibacillus sp. E222 TaxID=2748863 RepID=UPI0015C6973E|nr:hypothetical protein [Paenibacillus sp. E222]QLG39373.1 hypothetical protein HW560_15600 [Paenibacillus sp. E222]